MPSLALQDAVAGFYVSDEWKPGGVQWQRYNAAGSAWVDGERVVGQRKIGIDEIFRIYVYAPTPAGIKERIETVVEALSQYRYSVQIEWDGAVYNFQGNGAGEVRIADDNVDPTLHRAGWLALEITVPRDPGIG